MKLKNAGIYAVLLLITSSYVSLGSIIQNGSFETGDFTGWTSAGNIKVSAVARSARPSDGLYGLYWNYSGLTPDGELSQSFAANIGTTYLLEFDFAKGDIGSGTASLDVKVEGTGLLLDEIVNDSTGGSPGAWSNYVFSFTADNASLLLSFVDNTSGAASTFDSALDNISITAVPEPSAIALMGLASGCILIFRRQFRS